MAAVILAAGRSERYGSDKLALPLPDGRTVLGRSVEAVLTLHPALAPVFLVTPAPRTAATMAMVDRLGPGPEGEQVRPVATNPGGGQGDSLAAGIRAVRDQSEAGAALIVLADQPFALDATWEILWAAFRAHPDSVATAAEMDGLPRPPVLVRRQAFEDLAGLHGDVGGRRVLEGLGPRLYRVPFADGLWARDVDTPEAYRDLLAALRGQASREREAAADGGSARAGGATPGG